MTVVGIRIQTLQNIMHCGRQNIIHHGDLPYYLGTELSMGDGGSVCGEGHLWCC